MIALLMMGAFACCVFVTDDSDAATVNIDSDSNYCGVSTSSENVKHTFKISGDSNYYYKAQFVDEDGASSGSLTGSTGTLSGSSGVYSSTVTLTAPLKSGDYRLIVDFFEDSDSETSLAEKTYPMRIVDPIVLSFTLKNDGESSMTFTAYFKINGEKVEDSVQVVTVPANGTKDVTYNYYTYDVEDTTYSLETDDAIVDISGLGEEKTFYAHDVSYSTITTIVVVALVFMGVVAFFIYRKPIVNKGKPKGRR